MFDRMTTLQAFVGNFIQKEKRERCFGQLMDPRKRRKFTDRLNHRWDSVLRMERLVQIPSADDNGENIKRLLDFRDQDLCYVISSYSLYDDKVFPFQEIFDQIYAQGLGTILVNLAGDTLFLDTEQERGPAARFIGRVTSIQ